MQRYIVTVNIHSYYLHAVVGVFVVYPGLVVRQDHPQPLEGTKPLVSLLASQSAKKVLKSFHTLPLIVSAFQKTLMNEINQLMKPMTCV